MTSAVLPTHGAAVGETTLSAATTSAARAAAAPKPAADVPAAAAPAVAPQPANAPHRPGLYARALWLAVFPPIAGIALLVGIWALATAGSSSFPTPAATFDAAWKLFADPFYRNGPNDQGIGWNVLYSLERVGVGFGLAALVGIPLGFVVGRFDFASRMVAPLISLLKPVSPLAWLPIGLLVFKAANPAAIWTIFICSIWPMVVNTAVGVQRVPQDYLNVARVLDLSEWKVVTRILFPAVLPYMLTGVRLSVGTAWLVIVAAEMLTGGVGIGFWVWDEWNNLNVQHILVAIFVIGAVGLLLEQALMLLARRFTFDH
ncbi:MAG: nitrate ABC transporter permease [Burkholderiales bacterium]|nr:nitrate ABC transporter permease [Burkholderiales bacterium]